MALSGSATLVATFRAAPGIPRLFYYAARAEPGTIDVHHQAARPQIIFVLRTPMQRKFETWVPRLVCSGSVNLPANFSPDVKQVTLQQQGIGRQYRIDRATAGVSGNHGGRRSTTCFKRLPFGQRDRFRRSIPVRTNTAVIWKSIPRCRNR